MFKFLKTSYQKVKDALQKSSSFIGKRLFSLFSKGLNEETIEELEELLYEADLGSKTVFHLVNHVKSYAKQNPSASSEDFINAMTEEAISILEEPPEITGNESLIGYPKVILVLGANASGKTTTIAKLAKLEKQNGKKVLIAAGDTFRAAAGEQLEIWANRIGVDIVKSHSGADPSSVLYDAMQKATIRKYDLLLCDTSGRLETKEDLMREVAKMAKVARKQDETAPHEVFLILDASIGQNAIEQARIFNKHVPITGLIITKLDGTAKGGVLLGLYKELHIPIYHIGTGEKVDDLSPFEAQSYARALFQP